MGHQNHQASLDRVSFKSNFQNEGAISPRLSEMEIDSLRLLGPMSMRPYQLTSKNRGVKYRSKRVHHLQPREKAYSKQHTEHHWTLHGGKAFPLEGLPARVAFVEVPRLLP